VIRHRPHGIEHPYATSADQRVPVQPLVGQAVRLGVTADVAVRAISCEWQTTNADGTTTQTLALSPATLTTSDAAALVGGDGHLAEAQAEALTGAGGWSTHTDPLAAGSHYRYRFSGLTEGGERIVTDWYELAPAQWTPAAMGQLRGDTARVIDGSLEWLVAGDRVHHARFALPLRDGDQVVGFGERFDAVDQRGRSLDAVVFEQYKSQGRHGRTYLPMPFAHVVGADGAGWGFHVRTSRRTWYDVGASSSDRLVIEVDLGNSPDAEVDLGVFTGTPHAVLTAFLDEVGRAESLPAWVFRLWASGNEWNTQALVMERMDAHRELDIPVGAVVIEAWSDEEGITIFRDAEYARREDGSALTAAEFTYPPHGAWPDPKAMIDELHARGIKVLLWQIPLQKTDPELTGQVHQDADAMIREGHAVREADGSAYHNRGWWFPRALMPDLSAARTRDWWTDKRRYLVRELDVDGFKTDGGEHAWGHDLRYADGRLGDEGNNLYPVHYARTFGDLLRSEGKAPVTFSRAGFTGSQAHGIYWAGDEDSTWEAFRCSITAGLTAASCGIVYWGWDLAGFSGPQIQLGVHADHAVPLGVQPPPSSTARSHPVARRSDHRRGHGDPALPAVRAAARTPRRLPRGAGRAHGRYRPAADASDVFRLRRRPADLGTRHAVDAGRRPPRQPGHRARRGYLGNLFAGWTVGRRVERCCARRWPDRSERRTDARRAGLRARRHLEHTRPALSLSVRTGRCAGASRR